jgi:hypothetical protein
MYSHGYIIRGGHGGLRKDQMLVPYILKGPGVLPRKILDTALVEVKKYLFK